MICTDGELKQRYESIRQAKKDYLALMVKAPPGYIALPVAKGCIVVIPQQAYLAGLKLGKRLRRREAMVKRGRRE